MGEREGEASAVVGDFGDKGLWEAGLFICCGGVHQSVAVGYDADLSL